jgi:DNA-binding transcriptional regulator YiaG
MPDFPESILIFRIPIDNSKTRLFLVLSERLTACRLRSMITPKHISELQKALGLTTAEFAKKLKVKSITVFQWKSGRRHPRYEMQLKLTKLLDQVAAKPKA